MGKTDKVKLLNKISGILDLGFKKQGNRILNKTSGWTDAADAYMQENKLRDSEIYVLPRSQTIEDHIHRRLGHIIVSLKCEFNTKALIESYIYSNGDNGADPHFVNFNTKSTDLFVDTLIKEAKHLRELSIDNDYPDLAGRKLASAGNHFVLYGKRGSGKTFFLNHIISKYVNTFDREKILWIRINLVDDFGEIDDIYEWLYAQLVKIVYRYYDKNSVMCKKNFEATVDVYKILSDYANEVLDNEMRLKLKSDIEYCKRIFTTSREVKPIRKGLIDKNLGSRLYDHLIRKGFSVIFVIDGFDKLEALAHQEKKFEQLCGLFQSTLSSGKPPSSLFLLVTRTNNIPILRDKNISVRPNAQRTFSQYEKELKTVDFEKILKKRLEYIKDEVQSLYRNKEFLTESERNIYGTWPKYMLDFESFLNEYEPEKNEYYKLLQEIYGDNKRAQMQTVQCNYWEFLKKIGQRYVLVESLVRAGRNFPPKPYNYKLSGNTLERFHTGSNIFDNHFLPNIFLFPYCSQKYDMKEQKHLNQHWLLAGLRMMQIVQSHSQIVIEQSQTKGYKIDMLKADEIADILFLLFGYPKDVIMLLIEEFSEYELFFVGGVDVESPISVNDYKPKPMPKMKYILENAIYDIAYLNLCSFRVPLSKAYVDNTRKPLIKAVPFTITENKNGVEHWVKRKITNTISMFRIISMINKKEEEIFNKKQHKLAPRYAECVGKAVNEGAMFAFVIKQKQAILTQINQILSKKIDFDSIETLIKEYVNIRA